MEPDESPRSVYLTLEEAAEILRVSAGAMRQYARQGIVPARKIGKHWRFLESELREAGQKNHYLVSRSSVYGSRVSEVVRSWRNRSKAKQGREAPNTGSEAARIARNLRARMKQQR
jgi:excisionase family DNA binding protein